MTTLTDAQIDAAFHAYLERTHADRRPRQTLRGNYGYSEEEWEGFEAGYRAALEAAVSAAPPCLGPDCAALIRAAAAQVNKP